MRILIYRGWTAVQLVIAAVPRQYKTAGLGAWGLWQSTSWHTDSQHFSRTCRQKLPELLWQLLPEVFVQYACLHQIRELLNARLFTIKAMIVIACP